MNLTEREHINHLRLLMLSRGSLADYGSDTDRYNYRHNTPYSIVATYDQGSNEAILPEIPGTIPPGYPYDTEAFESSILIMLAILSFAFAFKHKRRSKSKFASDILTDVMQVRDKLNDNNHKSDSNAIILRLHAWKSNVDKRHFVEGYRDYQKIDDFYSTVRSRTHYLLGKQVSTDKLNTWNQDCVNKATIVFTEIDWRKFHKLDLVLLIPAIILGTMFIDAATEELGTVLPMIYTTVTGGEIYEIIFSGISSFFIIRLILKATQGVIVDNFGFPPIFRSYAFLIYCFVIVGIIPVLVDHFVLNPIFIFHQSSPCIDCLLITSFIVVLGSMFFLTWAVWRWYMTNKVMRGRHFLFKKQ
jgi:hypothetical protein